MNYEQSLDILSNYSQSHLLKYYDELSYIQQENLLKQISMIDFELITSLYSRLVKKRAHKPIDEIAPIETINMENLTCEEKEHFYNIGMDAIKNGKVAALLIAGGQGSRLGYNGPKGAFNINLPSGKSLFQLQAERLINLSVKAKKHIEWYIMTSPENNEDTITFFENNNYFGYDKSHINFFSQDVLPAIDVHGKIILEDKHKIAMSPSGNGDCFLALKNAMLLDDMKNKGIEWISVYGVDNALVKVADPYFLGFTICSKKPVGSKAISKKNSLEKVGVFCYKNNHPSIIEYSEIPKQLELNVDSDGGLIYDAANILNHILSITFIEDILQHNMPYHLAHKKITYLNEDGIIKVPKEPNAYKFERFMFDYFSTLSEMAVLKVERESEFAPVKNKQGEDSPYTARESILKLHKKWLINNGVDPKIIENKIIEISPLISYYGENIDIESIKKLLSVNDVLTLDTSLYIDKLQ